MESYSSDGTQDVVMCLNEVKMGILAKSVLLPGSIPFVMNLVTSYSGSSNPVSSDTSSNNSNNSADNSNTEGGPGYGDIEATDATLAGNTSKRNWLSEYEMGCQCKYNDF